VSAFSAVKDGDSLFPRDFGEDLYFATNCMQGDVCRKSFITAKEYHKAYDNIIDMFPVLQLFVSTALICVSK